MVPIINRPCGIFWDIENVAVPRNCAADVIAQTIRSTIVEPKHLQEREFYCVCNVHQLNKSVGNSLESIGVTIVQPFYCISDNAADTKILLLISKFIKNWGSNGCTIIVLTGDSDFLDPLIKLKLNHDLTVYLIHSKNSFYRELLWCADVSYQLDGTVLRETSPTSIFRGRTRRGFIKISNLPQDSESHNRVHEIDRACRRLKPGSRVLRITKGTVWIGYTSLTPSMTGIDLVMFAGIKFLSENQEPRLELVSSLWSELQTNTNPNSVFLPAQNKMAYFQAVNLGPDRVYPTLDAHSADKLDSLVKNEKREINMPKVEVMTSYNNNAKSPRKRRRRVDKGNSKNYIQHRVTQQMSKPGKALNEKEASFMNIRKLFICLNGAPNSELTTHWGLMHNIVSKTVGHSIKKVILQGKDFWLQFDDEQRCQQVVNKIITDQDYLKPLQIKKSISPSKKLLTLISNYPSDNPWCLTIHLGLNYLKSSKFEASSDSNLIIAEQFVSQIKLISSEFKCVFVKLLEGTIWAGFPSIRTCENAKKRLNASKDVRLHMQSAQLGIFPAILLESISVKDLVGDALEMAKTWSEQKNNSLQVCGDRFRHISSSISIDSDADSNSVFSEKINANRPKVPCSSNVDGKLSTKTYMEAVSSVQGFFLSISDILLIQKKRFPRRATIVQVLVDFVGIPPKAAILDDNVVYFNYNTLEEVKQAAKIVETKLFDNAFKLKASIRSDVPVNWAAKKKYYFRLPKALPIPPKNSITFISISPVTRKEMKQLNNTLLALLQPFYVYFIRYFEDALWIGIGTVEQAEQAAKIFKENDVLSEKFTITVVNKLPKDFWRIVRESKKGSNEPSETSSVANTEPRGHVDRSKSSNETISIKKSTLPPKPSNPSVSNQKYALSSLPNNHQAPKETTGLSSDKILSSIPGTSVNVAKYVISCNQFMNGDKWKDFESKSSSESSEIQEPFKKMNLPPKNTMNINDPLRRPIRDDPPERPTRASEENSRKVEVAFNSNRDSPSLFSTTQKPIISYLFITGGQPFLTEDAFSFVKQKLLKYECLIVKKVSNTMYATFNNSEKRNKAQREIDGLSYKDIFGHTYNFLTRFVYNPSQGFLNKLDSEAPSIFPPNTNSSSLSNIHKTDNIPTTASSQSYSSSKNLHSNGGNRNSWKTSSNYSPTFVARSNGQIYTSFDKNKKKSCTIS